MGTVAEVRIGAADDTDGGAADIVFMTRIKALMRGRVAVMAVTVARGGVGSM